MTLHNNEIPRKQRALVLQGGGALGAYEAGVLSVLCKELAHEYREGPLFDVVAATSMGAINAAVLISNVVNRKKTWEEAAKELENFWVEEGKGLCSTPGFSNLWWEEAKRQKKFTASPEAARRYYSVKEYLKYGTPNVFLPMPPEQDSKFADQDNTWSVHDISPLQNTIERYSKDENTNKEKLSIATSWKNKEPRLLVISVDVAEGKTVAFDSYYTKAEYPENSLYEGDGITIDHVMASGTIPIFYKFREIPRKGGRKFCDGSLLSNTPFRELLQAHRDYWNRAGGEDADEIKIPDLDVYIINVHPSKQDKVPTDLDGVKDRINDITFMDRDSHYDEMVADLVADYTDLVGRLKELAKSHFENKVKKDIIFQNEFESLLNTIERRPSRRVGENKNYKEDLLKGRFRLTKVMRIENESYRDSISGKVGDFTSQSIRNLIEKGKQDARRAL
ncbi:MAG TPA: patatin-like phospholipase family protein, partial [Nitrososphaeraceae archaeon]|nr:patatin-like phospholipase family protein [Nitrososphaeraceae archaeon]